MTKKIALTIYVLIGIYAGVVWFPAYYEREFSNLDFNLIDAVASVYVGITWPIATPLFYLLSDERKPIVIRKSYNWRKSMGKRSRG